MLTVPSGVLMRTQPIPPPPPPAVYVFVWSALL